MQREVIELPKHDQQAFTILKGVGSGDQRTSPCLGRALWRQGVKGAVQRPSCNVYVDRSLLRDWTHQHHVLDKMVHLVSSRILDRVCCHRSCMIALPCLASS